jgi:hypothetical protein
VESTPGRGVDRRGNIALEHDPFLVLGALRIRDRDRGEQRLRIRMARMLVQRRAAGHLHDLSEIHDGNTIRDMFHDRQIVSDEQIRETELLLQILQQVQNLRLDRHVER